MPRARAIVPIACACPLRVAGGERVAQQLHLNIGVAEMLGGVEAGRLDAHPILTLAVQLPFFASLRPCVS